MRLFGTRAPVATEQNPPATPPNPLRVLRADGQRIDLTSRDAGQLLVASRQGWQANAFAYRDMIGELRYAIQLRARSVARARFYPAQIKPWPEDPAPLDSDECDLDPQLIEDAIFNFKRLPIDGTPDGFIARLSENLSIAGEVWVHIDPSKQFWVRSVSEITPGGDGKIYLSTLPTSTSGSRRVLDSDTEDILRMWVPHPEWGQLADSSLRCLMDVCEDVVLSGREMRAAARSRVAANGILLMPSTLSLVRSRDEDDDSDDSITSDTFMADFTAAMLAPIRDDGDSQAVVPIVIRGEIEDLKEVRHVVLQRADADHLIRRQEAAILRLLRGMDVQPEQVQGMGGVNHWGQWIIEASSIQHQVKPGGETVAAGLMQAFLHPALASLDHDPAAIAQIMIAVDVSELAENPNRGQDATTAHDKEVISDEALRQALGFDEDDKPDEFELIRRSLTKGRITPQAIPLIIRALDRQLPTAQDIANATGTTVPHPVVIDGQPQLPAGKPPPVAAPGQTVPNQPVPQPPAGAPVVASGAPIDALVDRVTVAADAAVARVLERAGARLRSAVQRTDRAAGGALAGIEPHLIPAKLGPERVERFAAVPDLIVDDYARLRVQVAHWCADAGFDAAGIAVAWEGLATLLNDTAAHAIFNPVGDGDLLVEPSEIRNALTATMEVSGQ